MGIVRAFAGIEPDLAPGVFVAENATVIGKVTLREGASIWYGAVLRGDVGKIEVGARSNVQDLACIHMSLGMSDATIGDEVTIGHSAVIHGAIIGDGALIGMGAVVLDNAEIGEEAIVAAGAVVPPNMKVPPRTLVRGTPAKVAKELSAAQATAGREGARRYMELAELHRT